MSSCKIDIMQLVVIVAVSIAFLSLASLFFLLGVNIITSEPQDIQTDCYDKYSAKIEGLTCTKTIYCNGFPRFLDDSRCKK